MLALLIVVAFLFTAVVSAVVSLPSIMLGIRAAKKAPERAKVRAIPWALLAGASSGIVIALIGFVWAAGIGDESAGEIAGVMFIAGLPLGFLLGAAMTFALVSWRGGRLA